MISDLVSMKVDPALDGRTWCHADLLKRVDLENTDFYALACFFALSLLEILKKTKIKGYL